MIKTGNATEKLDKEPDQAVHKKEYKLARNDGPPFLLSKKCKLK